MSLWVEKDALSGVFAETCEDLGVGLFACKGYPSHSSLWQWLQGLQEAYQIGRSGIMRAVVLYYGDHDPDGWQIPRSAHETLVTLARVHGLDVPSISFRRVALLMEQIEKYDPPPFPAKVSSSRYAGYIREHGTEDAWELDALKPAVLRELAEQSIEEYFDQGVYDEQRVKIEEVRRELAGRMIARGWLRKALES